MNTLQTIIDKYDLSKVKPNRHGATEIPNVGRKQLAELFHDLDFKLGVEIGVAAGVFSEIMMEANPGVELYGVDPYIKHDGYVDYQLASTFTKLENEAHSRLDRFGNFYHFIKALSMEALDKFEDGELDFVYLDGDHSFESVVADIAGWTKKLKKGGIISGHDFAHHGRPGVNIHVVEAVLGYTGSNHIKPWFILGNEAKDQGLIRESIRSWFWVN